MELQELDTYLRVMLNTFRVPSKKINMLKESAVVYLIDDFGIIICGIDRADYGQINSVVSEQFKNWRRVYITTQEDVSKKKYEVLWELMRGGYMKWLRTTYPHQIKNTLMGIDGLGTKILNERLRIWAEHPKYKYLIEDTKSVLQYGILREFSHDPGFFDYMPEEVG
ncbi:hypothetical protein KAU51_04805 [Candidatus Parcubacteria bacterium]|nr:hypothetical protein [Candidatus Parcubacteria bacterium]